MKKIILMTALLLLVLTSNAQLSWTARVGANVSGIENADSKMKLGWKVGAGADYSVSDLFSVRSMLYYTTKGCSKGKSDMGIAKDKSLNLGYLELPIMGSFHFGLGTSTSLVANVGPYAAYRVAKSSSEGSVAYKKFDYGVTCGLDFVVNKFVVGVEAQYGLATLAKTQLGKLHNINYSLVVGYKF